MNSDSDFGLNRLFGSSSESSRTHGSERVNNNLDLELGLAPGLWRLPTNTCHCCIYRVPYCLRQANPEAYTPQLVIIGPLHRPLKEIARLSSQSASHVTETKLMGYLNMEKHKRYYLEAFSRRPSIGEATINGFRATIRQNRERIRESYLESTALIKDKAFDNMILQDSVFILEFFLRVSVSNRAEKIGDPLIDEPCLEASIKKDLVLLENQLPYFILHELFNPIFHLLPPQRTLRHLFIVNFKLRNLIEDNTQFIHFTDLLRHVRLRRLPDRPQGNLQYIEQMLNADKLDRGGVKLNILDESVPEGRDIERMKSTGVSINVSFDGSCLHIPRFDFDGNTEITLRNIMALEQCHYPDEAHVCNYIVFLNLLIATKKDVELLVEKGIIMNGYGNHALVAETMNKLCFGVVERASYYHPIAERVVTYFNSGRLRACTSLKQGYFKDNWATIATVAAVAIVVMTFLGLVASIIQAVKAFH